MYFHGARFFGFFFLRGKKVLMHQHKMSAYCQEVRKLEGTFDGQELTHVFRNDNNEADELAKMGSRWTPVPTGVFVQQLYQPTINEEATEPVSKLIEAEVLTIN